VPHPSSAQRRVILSEAFFRGVEGPAFVFRRVPQFRGGDPSHLGTWETTSFNDARLSCSLIPAPCLSPPAQRENNGFRFGAGSLEQVTQADLSVLTPFQTRLACPELSPN